MTCKLQPKSHDTSSVYSAVLISYYIFYYVAIFTMNKCYYGNDKLKIFDLVGAFEYC